jgi:methylmalonyl-CoA mutase N-terminal domain/subunit
MNHVSPAGAPAAADSDTICSPRRKCRSNHLCSYHPGAGATPQQELAFALATAIAVLDNAKRSGAVAPGAFGEVAGHFVLRHAGRAHHRMQDGLR